MIFTKLWEKENEKWWISFSAITVLGVASRLYCINKPNQVVWDEAHFGKFGSWYLNRTFFFDVHPPGGKLMIALLGYMSGYNGTFQFKTPGDSYEGYEEILYMRAGCALLGSLMVPFAFLCVWELSHSLMAALLSGFLCIYEIGTIALSKFILLDPLLMVFMMSSFYGITRMQSSMDRPWSRRWWVSLCYTGVSLGLVISVKFVGAFIILTAGLHTIVSLWKIYGDSCNSVVTVVKHFLSRVLGLIILPGIVYVFIFAIHDTILFKLADGNDLGAGSFSPGFQMHLVNSSLYNLTQPKDVAYGSIIDLRNDHMGGGYLHSHNSTYPKRYDEGRLQQVTSMRSKDENNLFRLLFPDDDPDLGDGSYGGELEFMTNEDWVRLYHVHTKSFVATHKNKSVVASRMRLVYALQKNLTEIGEMENRTMEDEKSVEDKKNYYHIWNVQVEGNEKENRIEALKTRFQLINPVYKCALTWTKENLPHTWGFNQGEVGCTKNMQDPYTFWKVEQVRHHRVPNATFEHLLPTFWSRFIETHQMMTWVNARLKPDESVYNPNDHKPWMWPIMYQSQPWYDTGYRVVLLGNPLVFLINFIIICSSPAILLLQQATIKRRSLEKMPIEDQEESDRFSIAVLWLTVAFLIHYLPFFFMYRILYYHHYFPALQFNSMLSAIVICKALQLIASKITSPMKKFINGVGVVTVIILLTVSFYCYMYVAYGHDTQGAFNLDNSTHRHVRFNDRWEI